MNISAVIPAYNEKSNIRVTIRRSLEALHPLFHEFEVIIVDDKSTDGTSSMADELAASHPEIKVIHNSVNVGQGGSLVTGFQAAKYDLVIHNAMDYPFDFKDLSKMLPLIEDADVVVAVRHCRAGYTLYRTLTSVVNLALLKLLFGLHIRDYNFVQLYKRPVLAGLSVESRSTAFLTPEILIRAHDMGYRIREVEVEYHARERGVVTSGSPRVIFNSLRDMLKFWLKRRRQAKTRGTLPPA